MKSIIAKGIDVSNHNGIINWNQVRSSGIKFVMIRAGYGNSTVDDSFIRNITGAHSAGLDVGIYWFSYAHNTDEALREAEFCLKTIEPYRSMINMPVCFDWEYDSDNYVKRTYGFSPDMTLVSNLAVTFLSKIESAGYYAMNYANIDYMNRYYNSYVKERFDTWIAQWSSECEYGGKYGIWQYGAESNYIDSKYVSGISGIVDRNYMYTDYPAWYRDRNKANEVKNENQNPPVVNVPDPPKNDPEPVKQDDNSGFKIETGKSINLKNTDLYASASQNTPSSKKTGTFFIYSNEVVNGKIRITNYAYNVGKMPAGMYVTGWIKVSDLMGDNAPASVSEDKALIQGTEINLKNTPLYSSAASKNPSQSITGKYWLYDGMEISGRFRITNLKSNVGKVPIGSYVTGWINKSDIK